MTLVNEIAESSKRSLLRYFRFGYTQIYGDQ